MANERARALRRNMTDAERRLWRSLRGKQLEGFRFRRQHPMGEYIVDFICLDKKLVIELDGSQHGDKAQRRHDERRDAWLESVGFRVVRYWNADIFTNLDGVLDEILKYLRDPTVGSPPP